MNSDWIELSNEPIDVAQAMRLLADSRAGGIAVFLGTTRAQTDAGRNLLALDYEAYAEMAESQLHELARQARDRWPIVKLALLHRTGRVALGEPSVLIAVATPHRAQAFDACRWLIDTLKSSAAIWKKEIWTDGSATWSSPPPP